MSENVVVCHHQGSDGRIVIVYYWPSGFSTLNAPSACVRYFWEVHPQ